MAELEKALNTPSNVIIYKQHWDYCARLLGLLHNVMRFCERKFSSVTEKKGIADKDSYILFWEMLLLRIDAAQAEGSFGWQ